MSSPVKCVSVFMLVWVSTVTVVQWDVRNQAQYLLYNRETRDECVCVSVSLCELKIFACMHYTLKCDSVHFVGLNSFINIMKHSYTTCVYYYLTFFSLWHSRCLRCALRCLCTQVCVTERLHCTRLCYYHSSINNMQHSYINVWFLLLCIYWHTYSIMLYNNF